MRLAAPLAPRTGRMKANTRWRRKHVLRAYDVLGDGPRNVIELARKLDVSEDTAGRVIRDLAALGDVARIRMAGQQAPPAARFQFWRRIESGEAT